jgi:hypothetical protein
MSATNSTKPSRTGVPTAALVGARAPTLCAATMTAGGCS